MQHKLGDVFLHDGSDWCLIGKLLLQPEENPKPAGELKLDVMSSRKSAERLRKWIFDRAWRMVGVSTGDDLVAFEASLIAIERAPLSEGSHETMVLAVASELTTVQPPFALA